MTRILRLMIASCVAIILHATAVSQSLSINNTGNPAHASAILDVTSTTKGMLVPRMNKTDKNAIIAPANGLLVYQTGPDSTGFYYYNGTAWVWLATASGSQGWLTTGNTGTDSAINFLGTLDNKPLMLRQNNLWMGQLNTRNHNYFIGAGSGFNNTGQYNTALGDSALFNNTTANQNTAIGAYALRNDATGTDNVAVGYQASYENDTASYTIAIGTEALYFNTIDSNVAIGYRAGYFANANPLNPSREQTFIGTNAGYGSFVSSKNTAIGFKALEQRNPATGLHTDYNNGGRNTAIGDSAMSETIGISNVAIGTQSLSRGGINTLRNVAIGDSAMGASSMVSENVAIGFKSLSKNNNGVLINTGNTATGAYSGRNLTSGYWNTINGVVALENATTAAGNTAIGTSSFRSNVTGFENVGVGINTGFHVTSGANTYLGSYAGEGAAGLSTGGSNTGVGYLALSDIRSGVNNTALGRDALRDDTSGSYNVAIGLNSMQSNLGSDFNTAVGYNSLVFHKRDGFTYNTALGSFAMEQDSSGFFNTGAGTSTFRFNKTGSYNTGAGINAGYYQKESYNTFIGAYSGVGERLNLANVTADTGNYNTGLGAYSMWRIANGSNNVALGYSALYNDSSGNLNTAVGNGALYSNTGSHNNQAFGWNALYSYNNTSEGWNNAFGDRAAESLTNGTQNVVMGSWAFLGHNSGSFNTVVGNSAMGNGLGLGGSNNTSIGSGSLYNNTGTGNTAVGNNAGDGNTTGTLNTLLGYNADVTSPNLTNATAIGYNATVAQSNSLVLGASGTNVGIGTTTPGADLDVNGTFRLGTVAGGATILNEIVKVTVLGVAIPIIPVNGTISVIIAVPGASTTSSVSVSPGSALLNGTIIAYARVTGVDQVTIWFNNGTAANIAAQTENFYVTAIR